jgi:hypothetical protein
MHVFLQVRGGGGGGGGLVFSNISNLCIFHISQLARYLVWVMLPRR